MASLGQWPMVLKPPSKELIVDLAWEKWGHDLQELSLDSPAVYQRLHGAKDRLHKQIVAGAKIALSKLERNCSVTLD